MPPLYSTYPIETIRDLLLECVQRYDQKPALQSKQEGEYRPTTYRQLGERVKELATFLSQRGVQPGGRVGVLGENSTEWAIAYLAVVTTGRIVVPIDKDLTSREIRHIVDYSGVSLLFCSRDHVASFRDDKTERIASLSTIVSMEGEAGRADFTIGEALQHGLEGRTRGDRCFEDARLTPDDVAAILFTSGTMGNSKGVMLTHANLAANIISTSQFVSISNDDRLLSVLPMHHTYECTCGFLTGLYQGATIFHAENLRRIPENLKESQASVMLGVPVLFETIYRRIEKGLEEKGARVKVAKGFASLVERFTGVDLRRRLFKELHEKFGGRLRLLISGGAAINPEVSRGYRELGINFIQGYGMTESAPLIAVNREQCLKDSSAGIPIPGVEVKIVDGEILVRGSNVMKGYYLNPGATAETLDGDWLRTGDLGHLDKDGFLFISGRKKALIVTPNGKNVYPEEVEKILNESPFVLESLVWGGPEEDPSLVEVQAIIVINTDAFDEHFGASQYDEEKIRSVIGDEIKKANRKLANYKRIKKFTIREYELEKTTTRKIKRYLYTGKPKPLKV